RARRLKPVGAATGGARAPLPLAVARARCAANVQSRRSDMRADIAMLIALAVLGVAACGPSSDSAGGPSASPPPSTATSALPSPTPLPPSPTRGPTLDLATLLRNVAGAERAPAASELNLVWTSIL